MSKNLITQTLQLGFALTSESVVTVHILRNVYLPMVNNHILNFFACIESIKKSMLPYPLEGLRRLYEWRPKIQEFWALNADDITKIKKILGSKPSTSFQPPKKPRTFFDDQNSSRSYRPNFSQPFRGISLRRSPRHASSATQINNHKTSRAIRQQGRYYPDQVLNLSLI